MKGILSKIHPYISPERLFLKIHRNNNFVWLDSSMNCSGGRYSLMAYSPFLVFRSKGNDITVTENGTTESIHADPLSRLQELFHKYTIDYPFLFTPGAIGFFSYDLGRMIEKIPETTDDDLNLPDIHLGFYQTIILFDHQEQCVVVMSINLPSIANNAMDEFKSTNEMIENLSSQKRQAADKMIQKIKVDKLSSNILYKDYIEKIKKVKNYIAQGDVYQINFSQRLLAEGTFSSPEDIYLSLRNVNPTLYSGFMSTRDFTIMSNSPELFLKKTGNKLLTKPMKGTRPRGRNNAEDARYKEDLENSVKDKAELIMIVDLERNDIGKVCEYGSVKVKKLIQTERYKTVYQTTSVVEGMLRQGAGFKDIMSASFPGGSITGAPKIRAMEIIEELEYNRRSFYTGSMGYVGFNGNFELNIMIRTLLLKANRLYYPVGGGIVWDSKPEEEYEETLTKAGSLFKALGVENAKELLS